MKKIVGFIGTYSFYYTGYVVAYFIYSEYGAWMYPIYNILMTKSSDIQDWAGLSKPWKEIK